MMFLWIFIIFLWFFMLFLWFSWFFHDHFTTFLMSFHDFYNILLFFIIFFAICLWFFYNCLWFFYRAILMVFPGFENEKWLIFAWITPQVKHFSQNMGLQIKKMAPKSTILLKPKPTMYLRKLPKINHFSLSKHAKSNHFASEIIINKSQKK